MGGKSSSQTQQTQQQSQSGTTAPWSPTQGLLQQVLGSIGNNFSPSPTPAENTAFNNLIGAAGSIPNFVPQGTDLAGNLLTGGPDYSGIVNSAYANTNTRLAPFMDLNNIDPTKNPLMAPLLDRIKSDVTNTVDSQFAGAGRDLSGTNQQALARGISQGEAEPLFNQFNTNTGNYLNSVNTAYGNANNTADILSNLFQTQVGNKIQGLNVAAGLPGMATAGPAAVLQALESMRGFPLNNIGNAENLVLPIAGLGSQYSGQGNASGTSNTTNQMSGAQQFALIANGLGGLFGGGASPVSNMSGIFKMGVP